MTFRGQLMAMPPSTTLADLFKLHVRTYPFVALRASLRRHSSYERDDGVTDGRQAWLEGRRSVDSFSSSRFLRRLCCRRGEGQKHRHECTAVKALPGSPFEVVEPKFLFQLLMGLLANPSSLDSQPRCTDRSQWADWQG